MVTNNFFRSDLYSVYNIIRNAMTLYPKELIIATLRDYFSHDSWYSYQHDQFGFPLTPSNLNLPSDAGIAGTPDQNLSTRVFIGEAYRFDVAYYPMILVRHGGATSVPISMNRNAYTVKWGNMVFEDGYGNIKTFPQPEFFRFNGAWEGSINIEIRTKDLRSRDDLVDLVSILFVDIAFDELVKAGLVIKGVSAGAHTETDDRNDHIFAATVTLQFRGEWARAIPISNVVDIINFTIEFGRLLPEPSPDPNLAITIYQDIWDFLSTL